MTENKRLNIGILAHVDSGKTSLTEQMLFLSGAIRKAGTVDEGTTQTDWLEVERRRGISVHTASVGMNVRGTQINLVDTPGHVDFAGEVERCLAVLDGAVLLVSAVEGVQAYTEKIWHALNEMQIPMVVMINKIDRVGSNVEQVLKQLRELSPNMIPIQTYEGEGTMECKVSSVVKPDSMNQMTPEIMDEIAMGMEEFEPELVESYLNDEPEIASKLIEAFITLCKTGKTIPVVVGSAKLGLGIQELLDACITYLPDASALRTEQLSGLVYQVSFEEDGSKAAHIRLFGGSLKNRDQVFIAGKDEQEPDKITQIRFQRGGSFVDVGEMKEGEIATVYGLTNIKSGDFIGQIVPRRKPQIATPTLLVKIHPVDANQLIALQNACIQLSEEEPLLQYEWNKMTNEMYLHSTGKIQLEILEEMLQDRYQIPVVISKPTVIQKETPKKMGIGMEAYTMPKPCWAIVQLKVEPMPRGSGVTFESVIKDKVLPYRYQHHVEQSVFQTIIQGIHGWEVTDCKVTLIWGEHHNVHTHPLDFFVATPIALLRALTDGESQILEPYQKLRLSATEEVLGKVIGDILAMGGEFESPIVENGRFQMQAIVPVETSLEYSTQFQSMTSGKGSYSESFYEYRECPVERWHKLERRGVDPLDRSRWILSCRSAL